MTELVVEIPGIKWEKQRKLDLDKGFKDAIRDYCKQRWPHHTAKYAARAFKLTVDQGRSVANGAASITTIEKCLKEGGPQVAVPVVEEVIGMKLSGFFRDLLLRAAQGGADALAHEQNARAAYRALAAGADEPGADRNGSAPAREAWSGFGTLGAEAPRRVAHHD